VAGLTQQTERKPPQELAAIPMERRHGKRDSQLPPLVAHWDRATGLAVANTVAVKLSMEHATTNITMTNCIFGTSVTVFLCFFPKACGRRVYYCLEEPV